MTQAFIGIGANLGDPAASVRAAVAALAALPGTTLVVTSSLYRTAPVDAGGDDYINAVACIETALDAPALLTALQHIELLHGRERPYRNAPRTLDLDILLFGSAMRDDAQLTVPHPRMTERAFVLVPLLEIAPDVRIPGKGAAHDWLAAVSDQRITPLAS